MSTKNIKYALNSRLQKYNLIRMLRADVFALSKRELLTWLRTSGRDNHQIAHELNKLRIQTNGGIAWTSRSVRRLSQRLHKLTLMEATNRTGGQSMKTIDPFDVREMDVMYHERLDLLYLGSTEFLRGGMFVNPPYVDF